MSPALLLNPGTPAVIFPFSLWGLRWIFAAACGLSVVAAGGSYALVVMSGLLTGVTSLAEVHGLSCPAAGGIILDQGLDPRARH